MFYVPRSFCLPSCSFWGRVGAFMPHPPSGESQKCHQAHPCLPKTSCPDFLRNASNVGVLSEYNVPSSSVHLDHLQITAGRRKQRKNPNRFYRGRLVGAGVLLMQAAWRCSWLLPSRVSCVRLCPSLLLLLHLCRILLLLVDLS